MPGITAATKIAYDVIDAISNSKDSSSGGIANTVMDKLGSNNASLVRFDGSLTKLLTKFTVEPVIIASTGAKDSQIIDRILELNTDVFAAYYMQAFEVLKNMYDVQPKVIVEMLGTENSKVFSDAIKYARKAISSEEQTDEVSKLFLSVEDVAGKRLDITDEMTPKAYRSLLAPANNGGKDGGMSDQPTAVLLQRNLNVTLMANGSRQNEKGEKELVKYSVVLPIIIKAHVIFVPLSNILTMLAPNSRDKEFGYRWDEFKSGAISGWDLIFCGDLIKKYKDNKLSDRAGLIELINNRTISANSKVLSLDPNDKNPKFIGFEKNYNMLVITSDDKVQLDKHVNGNIKDEKYKQILLTQAHALTMTIIDSDYERVEVYTKDIRGKSDIGFKALSKRKDSGYDLTELIKAMMSNNPPRL